MAFRFGAHSLAELSQVRPELQRVMHRAIQLSSVDFRIQEGLRTLTRERRLVAAGASTTLNSRHLTGEAVDVVALIDGHAAWNWPLYEAIAKAVGEASAELGIPIEWGGNWRTFKDGTHFQLRADNQR